MPKKKVIKTEIKTLSSTKLVASMTAMMLMVSAIIAVFLTWFLFS